MAQWVRQPGSEAADLGLILCRAKLFLISLTFVKNSIDSHGTVGVKTKFCSGRYRFESQPVLTFWKLNITTERRETARPSYAWKILIREISLNVEGFPYEIFRYCETKNFQQKNVISPSPLLCINFFVTRIFPKHRRVPVQNFSLLWDKKLPTESRDLPLPHPPPLCVKIFDTRNFLKHRSVPPLEFLALWGKKLPTENPYIPSYLFCVKFSDTRTFLEHRRVPLRNISVVRHKNFSWENFNTPSFAQNLDLSGGLDFCGKPLKTNFKTEVSFLNVCKIWSECLFFFRAKSMPGRAGRLSFYIFPDAR